MSAMLASTTVNGLSLDGAAGRPCAAPSWTRGVTGSMENPATTDAPSARATSGSAGRILISHSLSVDAAMMRATRTHRLRSVARKPFGDGSAFVFRQLELRNHGAMHFI